VPVRLGDVATIQAGPEMRRGIAELNGEGEVAGGVILRSGKNARETIAAVKDKLAELKKGLPPGVDVVTVYDRSQLIDRAVENLTHKLVEEFIVVAIVCGLFLWHVRSALVAISRFRLVCWQPSSSCVSRGQCQHHVVGRHRDRHRRDGRCRGRHDRECP
jgi:Cu(I)/Ag(I) efflux system membrane protein CusA/SilA